MAKKSYGNSQTNNQILEPQQSKNGEYKLDIIRRLKMGSGKSKILHNDVPEEYKDDIDIIFAERESGIRNVDKIGFDVINQVYFVDESVLRYSKLLNENIWGKSIKKFADFQSYYNYLDGKIYENACYYQCDLSNLNGNIDRSKMKECISFIDESIDDYTVFPSNDDLFEYREGEKRKKQIKKWIEKFIDCDSFATLTKIVESYNRSALYLYEHIDVTFFLWHYIFYSLDSKKHKDAIMTYLSSHKSMNLDCHYFVQNNNELIQGLSFVYGMKSELLTFMDFENLKKTKVYFDTKTHYYCESNSVGVNRYFETFDELLEYRNYDLSNADLTKDILLNFDVSKCKIDENTKLPISCLGELTCIVIKMYSDNQFVVSKSWYTKNDLLAKRYVWRFDYFFDFVAFLNGDLSNADLLLCDGLKNLNDISNIDFTGAKMISSLCDKFGVEYDSYDIDSQKIRSFESIEDNEKSTELVLRSSGELSTMDNDESALSELGDSQFLVYYISDLHLMHTLQHFGSKSENDVDYVIHNIVNNIVNDIDFNSILTIGGDVSSDFKVFEKFVQILHNELNQKHQNVDVIFVLGNHELWDFPDFSFNEIVEKYETLLTKYGMYFINNDVLYYDAEWTMQRMTEFELMSFSEKEIREKFRDARIILFGGLAFAGYDNTFNADNGIYGPTINRDEEIIQSKHFESLYDKILQVIPDKRVVILTHMSMSCWHRDTDYHKGYVYISGHTHKNYFYDDGDIRVYADNQIGYHNDNPHVKWLDLDSDYDYFSDYKDGIYEISPNEYKSFYRGKNESMTFNRKVKVLYMLKKNGYYCFICQNKSDSLCILNGGAIKKLSKNNIRYYYDNMDSIIATIRKPLDKYTSIQERIASEVRKFGGEGTIHGCIIDIDWYNHIYVNPIDLKVTGYWASDMTNKKIYRDVPSLLKKECPLLYKNYVKLIESNSQNLPIIVSGVKDDVSLLPQTYLNTDIYKVSRKIKQMQKLNSNVLTTWIEVADDDTESLKLDVLNRKDVK